MQANINLSYSVSLHYYYTFIHFLLETAAPLSAQTLSIKLIKSTFAPKKPRSTLLRRSRNVVRSNSTKNYTFALHPCSRAAAVTAQKYPLRGTGFFQPLRFLPPRWWLCVFADGFDGPKWVSKAEKKIALLPGIDWFWIGLFSSVLNGEDFV